jgi:hypothetical protein
MVLTTRIGLVSLLLPFYMTSVLTPLLEFVERRMLLPFATPDVDAIQSLLLSGMLFMCFRASRLLQAFSLVFLIVSKAPSFIPLYKLLPASVVDNIFFGYYLSDIGLALESVGITPMEGKFAIVLLVYAMLYPSSSSSRSRARDSSKASAGLKKKVVSVKVKTFTPPPLSAAAVAANEGNLDQDDDEALNTSTSSGADDQFKGVVSPEPTKRGTPSSAAKGESSTQKTIRESREEIAKRTEEAIAKRMAGKNK